MLNNYFFVMDFETTGLSPGDLPLELAIYRINLTNYQYLKVFDSCIKQELTEKILNSMMVAEGYIKAEEINNGMPPIEVSLLIKDLLGKQSWTSYNVAFDQMFLKQLYPNHPPALFCLMERMTDLCKIPKYNPYTNGMGYKWPKLQEAYYYWFKEEKEFKHRAAFDTELATRICIKLLLLDQTKDIINQKMLKKEKITLEYCDRNNKQEIKELEPLLFTDELYFKAHETGHGSDERTYRLDRIQRII